MKRAAFAALAALSTVLAFSVPAAEAGVTAERRPEVFCEFSSRDAAIDVSRVRIFLDGRDVTSSATVSSWRVNYLPDADLAIGPHEVRVIIYDERGNRRVKSWSFIVDPSATDTAGPAIRFLPPSPTDGSVLGGGAANIAVAFDDDGGSGLDPSSAGLYLSRDGGPFRNVTATARLEAGAVPVLRYSTGGLGAGTWLFRAVGADKLGNRGAESYLSFSVDDSAPTIASIAASPNPAVLLPGRGGKVSWRVSVEDQPFRQVASIEVRVIGPEGEVARLKEGPVELDAVLEWDGKTASGELAPPGVYRALVRAVDFGGSSVERAWDEGLKLSHGKPGDAPQAAAPAAPQAASDDGASAKSLPLTLDRLAESLRNATTIDLKGRGEAGAEVEVYVNERYAGSALVDASGDFLVRGLPLDEGRNRIHLQAFDHANGRSSRRVRANLTVTLDSTPPAPPTLRNPSDGTTFPFETSRITLSGEAESSSKVRIFVDGLPVTETTAGSTGRFSTQLDLEVGAQELSARALDAAGNEGPGSRPIRITRLDEVRLAVPTIDRPSNGQQIGTPSVRVEGRVEASGGIVRIYVNGAFKTQAFVRGGGSWFGFVGLEPGENRIRVSLLLENEESALSDEVVVTRPE